MREILTLVFFVSYAGCGSCENVGTAADVAATADVAVAVDAMAVDAMEDSTVEISDAAGADVLTDADADAAISRAFIMNGCCCKAPHFYEDLGVSETYVLDYNDWANYGKEWVTNKAIEYLSNPEVKYYCQNGHGDADTFCNNPPAQPEALQS